MFDPQSDPAPDFYAIDAEGGPAPELNPGYGWAGWEVRAGADFMDDEPAGPCFVWNAKGVRLLLVGDAYSESDWLLFPPDGNLVKE